jgi:hypothetical protein
MLSAEDDCYIGQRCFDAACELDGPTTEVNPVEPYCDYSRVKGTDSVDCGIVRRSSGNHEGNVDS